MGQGGGRGEIYSFPLVSCWISPPLKLGVLWGILLWGILISNATCSFPASPSATRLLPLDSKSPLHSETLPWGKLQWESHLLSISQSAGFPQNDNLPFSTSFDWNVMSLVCTSGDTWIMHLIGSAQFRDQKNYETTNHQIKLLNFLKRKVSTGSNKGTPHAYPPHPMPFIPASAGVLVMQWLWNLNCCLSSYFGWCDSLLLFWGRGNPLNWIYVSWLFIKSLKKKNLNCGSN